ncbi:MAG: B12-binding domain-containing radical SAM protein [Candidatus Bathyarchaeia archaeon]|jgi:radical SAM superfamily enzyme YgiQ (UPF0313 family)
MVDVLLTADRTVMSNYHKNEFVGFGACVPPNIIPDWLYSYLFFPPLKSHKGELPVAPYGLRKIEAQLLKEGFTVKTVSPDHLGSFLAGVKVLGIHAMDPFGLGPASTTFACLFHKEPFLAKHFRCLLNDPAIKAAKKRGLKIVVGGPGAWQFRYRDRARADLGIDCVVEGEAENAVGLIVKAAFRGQKLPTYYEVNSDGAPGLDEIPDIAGASINGLLEVGRGCCRGCQFCNVTLRPLRWYPVEKLEREINVNMSAGETGVCLHAEDVMLYGSNNTYPNPQALLKLHNFVTEKCTDMAWSHCSIAAVASSPKLFSKVSELVQQNQDAWGAETGIETGSPRLVEKLMPAKTHPFKPSQWREVVFTGMGLMHDYRLVPACTLIVGLPDEQESDVLKTMELIDDLKDYRSLIVPLFFVPLGKLSKENWFSEVKLSPLHKQLFVMCAEHDFLWAKDLIDSSFSNKWYGPLFRNVFKGFAAVAKHKLRQVEQV